LQNLVISRANQELQQPAVQSRVYDFVLERLPGCRKRHPHQLRLHRKESRIHEYLEK